MGIISAGITDIGQKRKSNQDSIYLGPNIKFYCVADGMGGHSGGDIASQMVVEHLPVFLEKYTDHRPKDLLKAGIDHVNEMIYERAQSDEKLKGMGTTVVGFLFRGQEVFICNLGDSRSYLMDNKNLYQLTRDHSLVQEKLAMGIYNRDQARRDKMKNVLVRTLGFEQYAQPDIYSYKVSRNQIFLLCSDGLHGKLSDEDISFVLNREIPNPAKATKGDLQRTAQTLVDYANALGGQDNISVILIIAQ